ncbi:hypothetical protein ACC771_07375, partial [Rhizobium ruizarguesonis]
MNKRFRPIHSGFETLRLAGDQVRSTQGYSRFGFATNEQMIARGTGINSRTARPNAIFSDFQQLVGNSSFLMSIRFLAG